MHDILFKQIETKVGDTTHREELFVSIARVVFDTANGRPHAFQHDGQSLADVAMEIWFEQNEDLWKGLDDGRQELLDKWAHVVSDFAVRVVPDDLETKIGISQAYDSGNYDGAYTGKVAYRNEWTAAQCDEYLLGFYSSYELHEIENPGHRAQIEALRADRPDDFADRMDEDADEQSDREEAFGTDE